MDSSKIERQRLRMVARRRIRLVTGVTAVAGTVLAAGLGVAFAGVPNVTSADEDSGAPAKTTGPAAGQPASLTDTAEYGSLPAWGHGSGHHGRSGVAGGLTPPAQPPEASTGGSSHAGSGAS